MNHFLRALMLKYESDKATAIAELSVLLQSPVGVAAHTNIVQEMHLKVKAIAESNELIKIVQEMIPQFEQSTQQQES